MAGPRRGTSAQSRRHGVLCGLLFGSEDGATQCLNLTFVSAFGAGSHVELLEVLQVIEQSGNSRLERGGRRYAHERADHALDIGCLCKGDGWGFRARFLTWGGRRGWLM